MAANYLLDSNTIIAAIKGKPHALLNRMVTLAPSRLYLSALVYAELQYGADKSQHSANARAALEVIVTGFERIAFDTDDAAAYARIRAGLERKGKMIGPMDCLIAAQAVARGLVVVTDNLREFQRVPGLQCENWMYRKNPA